MTKLPPECFGARGLVELFSHDGQPWVLCLVDSISFAACSAIICCISSWEKEGGADCCLTVAEESSREAFSTTISLVLNGALWAITGFEVASSSCFLPFSAFFSSRSFTIHSNISTARWEIKSSTAFFTSTESDANTSTGGGLADGYPSLASGACETTISITAPSATASSQLSCSSLAADCPLCDNADRTDLVLAITRPLHDFPKTVPILWFLRGSPLKWNV